ncbi:hypothetical protein EDC04DRAFT_2598421 [Pisolithus marmoratus]|nr:hypothetical protein EDC04DRAFT_2598421 [Pisolithus marmoratus]
MAKTTSKPRKSMGGTAPRVPFSGNNVGVTAIPESAPVNTQVQESTSKDLAVSHANTGNITLLGKGFYRDGKPVLSSWIKINRPFERSIRTRLLSHLTLVINLRLQGIPSGGPIMMATQILAPYFPNSDFHFLDVEFDIGNDARLKKYKQQVSRIITKIKSRSFRNVIIGLTNHLDSERGDLFIGSATEGNPLASMLSECLPVLLSPFGSWLAGAMFFLFSYRSVVSEEARLVTLEDTIIQLGLSSVIAFDAEDHMSRRTF